MKLLILSDASSSHTIKWANSLCQAGIEVHLFSLSDFDAKQFDSKIRIYSSGLSKKIKGNSFGNPRKVIYLFSIIKLKRLIKEIKPDILHAHYISSYGLLGVLCGFDPLFISVWGSDVTDFPEVFILYKYILKFIFKKADKIYSTSNWLAKHCTKFTSRNITIIPFGVDTNIFKKLSAIESIRSDKLVIGTVKVIDKNYGIEYLLKAFNIIKSKFPNYPMELMIVGDGAKRLEMEKLAENLDIAGDCKFIGHIPYSEIQKYHNQIDIEVFPSVNESFGVAVLEASACENPVVVTNVGGLTEVVDNNNTGYIVPAENEIEIAKAIEKLVLNAPLRKKMGIAGRDLVVKFFNWDESVNRMISEYKKVGK